MTDIAIRVDNLSKRYRIGQREPYKALRDVLTSFMYAPFRHLRKSPQSANHNPQSKEFIWALKDVSFEVKQGEVVGIIGRNGAGKTTLLKILSRITEPTGGYAEIQGRVGSLLEVGTGFHPELTGRENIYLNGAILGMRKAEIDKKFDEIVAFAEIEKFIDTPVKYYSSGMYVRLAFAVAAHLEPEILLVDEVLAVGDAAFQKKCLGKMGDVAREGRTVLFVSHNMAAVRMLCNVVIYLSDGGLVKIGPCSRVVASYESSIADKAASFIWTTGAAAGDEKVKLLSARTLKEDLQPAGIFARSEPILVELRFTVQTEGLRLNPHIHVLSNLGDLLFISTNLHDREYGQFRYPCGEYLAVCRIPDSLLSVGRHYISIYLISDLNYWNVNVEKAISFDVAEDGKDRGDYLGGWYGAIRPLLSWKIVNI